MVRERVILVCTECKARNYNLDRNKKRQEKKLELKKFCRFCRRHTLHKEHK